VGFDESFAVTLVKGYYLEASSGYLQGFLIGGSGEVIPQDASSWLTQVHSLTPEASWTAREVATQTHAVGRVDSTAVVDSIGGMSTGPIFDSYEDETCLACYDEYEAARTRQKADLAGYFDDMARFGEDELAGYFDDLVRGIDDSMMADAAVHCAQITEACSDLPHCLGPDDSDSCLELEPYCAVWQDIPGGGGQKYCAEEYFYTQCIMNEDSIYACATDDGIFSEEFTESALAHIAGYDPGDLVLPSDSQLPDFPPAPECTEDPYICDNGTHCEKGDDGHQCNGGNEQVCRESYGDWCQCEDDELADDGKCYCWQQTGLNNCR
jgi:hypothetical protein